MRDVTWIRRLALLGAISPVEPAWDRTLLVSLPRPEGTE